MTRSIITLKEKLRSYFELTKGTSTPPHGRVKGCVSWVIWRREIKSAHNKIVLLVPLQCSVNGILISLNVLSSNPTSSAITKGCCVIRQNWYPPIAIFNSVQASIIVEYEFWYFHKDITETISISMPAVVWDNITQQQKSATLIKIDRWKLLQPTRACFTYITSYFNSSYFFIIYDQLEFGWVRLIHIWFVDYWLLIHVKACCLVDNKPLRDTMLIYC